LGMLGPQKISPACSSRMSPGRCASIPFMLSKWRKQVKDGGLSGKSPALDAAAVAELQRLREVEGKCRQLQMEHDLQKRGSSPNSGECGRILRKK
jgi:hypothetical protein